jgi:hypothetical protein
MRARSRLGECKGLLSDIQTYHKCTWFYKGKCEDSGHSIYRAAEVLPLEWVWDVKAPFSDLRRKEIHFIVVQYCYIGIPI